MCELYGERLDFEGRAFYAFPTPETIASLDESQIDKIRAGYRGKYVLDAARRVAMGEIDERLVKNAPLEEALEELMKVNGVGIKVANCVALYGAGRMEAFPADIWIKRAMRAFYGEESYQGRFGKYAGICQQYLYFYARSEKIK